VAIHTQQQIVRLDISAIGICTIKHVFGKQHVYEAVEGMSEWNANNSSWNTALVC